MCFKGNSWTSVLFAFPVPSRMLSDSHYPLWSQLIGGNCALKSRKILAIEQMWSVKPRMHESEVWICHRKWHKASGTRMFCKVTVSIVLINWAAVSGCLNHLPSICVLRWHHISNCIKCQKVRQTALMTACTQHYGPCLFRSHMLSLQWKADTEQNPAAWKKNKSSLADI